MAVRMLGSSARCKLLDPAAATAHPAHRPPPQPPLVPMAQSPPATHSPGPPESLTHTVSLQGMLVLVFDSHVCTVGVRAPPRDRAAVPRAAAPLHGGARAPCRRVPEPGCPSQSIDSLKQGAGWLNTFGERQSPKSVVAVREQIAPPAKDTTLRALPFGGPTRTNCSSTHLWRQAGATTPWREQQ